uniref:GYF domain-containing protein n=1 Tax=Mesocestoides corti TaxID=53468 RepID=A0A5K3F2X1_MESCO
MEPTDSVFRYIYTKEELLQIRDEYMKHEDLVRFPVAPSIISLEPEVRLPYRKARPPKHVDVFFDANSQMPEDSPQRGGDECPGDPSQQPPSWRRSHRLSGGTPQSPLDSTGAPGNQRHNSGSSGGDDSGGCGAVRREFDWTLGCGKWRHRSTSGSERGNHKAAFFPGGGRGRGRGNAGDYHRQQYAHHQYQGAPDGPYAASCGTPTARGRGFMRRPHQSTRGGRGGGFKAAATPNSHNHTSEQALTGEDLKPHDHQHFSPHQDPSRGGEMRPPSPSAGVTSEPPDQPPLKSPHNKENGLVFGYPSAPPLHPPPPPPLQNHVAIQSEEPRPAKDFSFMSNFTPAVGAVPSGDVQTPPPQPPQPLKPPTRWYYRDLAGNCRGPYDDATMAGWFTAGYFPISVEVRRECDRVFSRLTDFITWLGRFPFIGSSELPPILESRPSAPPPPPTGFERPIQQSETTPPAPPQAFVQPPPLLAAAPIPTTTSISDLNYLTEVTLSEVIRLKRDAQRLVERVTALGVDQTLLAKTFAVLDLNAADKPANAIDVRQLEAALQQQQPAPVQSPPTKAISAPQPEAGVGDAVDKTPEPLSEVHKPPTVVQPPQPSPDPSEKQPPIVNGKAKNLKAPVQLPTIPEPVAEKSTGKKKSKAKKTKPAAVEEKTSAPPTPMVVPESENNGDTAPSVEVLEPPTSAVSATSPPSQQQEKKTKKKKKSKPTAADLQQQAWEQEEQRRRRLNAERIAREKAEAEAAAAAAATAEEEVEKPTVKLTAAAKRQQQEALLLQQQRKAREAAMKQAAESLAHLKLPETARWASTNVSASNNPPASLADIMASQMQEEEIARAQGWGKQGATFASKLAGTASPAAPAHHVTTKLVTVQPQSASGKPKATPPTTASPVVSQRSAQSKQSTKVATQPTSVPPVNPPSTASSTKTSVLSIWDLPSNPNITLQTAATTSTKKSNRKKKPNASSQLLTGPLITLPPKAKSELVKWSENQLAVFPRHNVDIPTLVGLLCDIEDAEDVLECIESSFGKSQRVSKFSKAFVEKRANLMGATA